MLPSSAISRVTGVNVEFRNFNKGGGAYLPQRLAVIGVGNDGVNYSLEKYEATGNADAVAKRYGYGSPLHLAARQLFPVSGGGANFPVTFYPLKNENYNVNPVMGGIFFRGMAEAAGSGTVCIGGINAEFSVEKGADAEMVICAVMEAIKTKLEMPVIVGSKFEDSGGKGIGLRSKWSSASACDITIEIETEVDGLYFEIEQMHGGAPDPDITPALEAIGQIWETFILSTFSWKKTERLDQYQLFCEGRWSELEKKPCIVAHGSVDDYETRTAVTDLRKSDYANFLIQSTGSRELPFVIAARGLVSDIMTNANSNPPLGYKGRLTGLAAGADSVQENYTTRNNAVAKGASTNIKTGSVAELNDIVTFYHPEGELIPPKRYVVDLVKLQNIVFNLRLIMEAEEKKGAPLVSDATVTTNPKAVQPKMVKAELMNLADSLSRAAIMQEPAFTKENLVVKIDSANPKRLNYQFPAKLSGNVEVISGELYFGFYLES
jgi:phage tail sheath gpL-like